MLTMLSFDTSRMRKALAAAAAGLLLGNAGLAAEPSLDALHADFANNYFEVEPLLRLARYLKDHGDPIMAFYLCEEVRRDQRVGDKQFDALFRKWVFDKELFDNSAANEARLVQALKRTPDDAALMMKLADLYVSRNDWKNSRPLVERARKLEPANFHTVAVLGEIDRRELGKDEKALYEDFYARNPESREAYKERFNRLLGQTPYDKAAVEAFLNDAHQRFPKAGEFSFALAELAFAQKRDEDAARLYEEAAANAPDNATVQARAARFFHRTPPGDAKALRYYLNAYLLDPRFRDPEYAIETRIRRLLEQDVARAGRAWEQGKRDIESLLADSNPDVVFGGVMVANQNWKPEHAARLTPLLGHESDKVRRAAAGVLSERVDRSYDATLRQLLEHADLRVRSLAPFIALRLWGAEGLAAVRPFLKNPAPMVQFNTAGAIFREGGAAGCVVLDGYRKEKIHPRIRDFLASQRVVEKCGWK